MPFVCTPLDLLNGCCHLTRYAVGKFICVYVSDGKFSRLIRAEADELRFAFHRNNCKCSVTIFKHRLSELRRQATQLQMESEEVESLLPGGSESVGEKPDAKKDNVEEEENTVTLPEALVVKIISMAPFPSVFRARVLSRSWLARFSPVSPHDKEKNLLAADFQKQVTARSSNWDTFCPIIFASRKSSFAYHSATPTKWTRIPSLIRYLPSPHYGFPWTEFLQVEGALLYAPGLCGKKLYVGNILTGSWKVLPDCPHADFVCEDCKNLGSRHYAGSILPRRTGCFFPVVCERLIIDPSSETYKVIRFGLPCDQLRFCAQTYDSQLNAWTRKELELPRKFSSPPVFLNSASLNGNIYMVTGDNPEIILEYSVERGTLIAFNMSGVYHNFVNSVHLVVCNATLMMVVTKYSRTHTFIVAKVDLESGQLIELARGPPTSFKLDLARAGRMRPVGDQRSCIFFTQNSGIPMLTYNLQLDVWSYVPLSEPASEGDRPLLPFGIGLNSSFQPGLSPFMIA